MTIQPSNCDETSLRVLLNAAEDSIEFQTLSAHVEACETCQQRLCELAAQKDDWADIPRYLNSDELDGELEIAVAAQSWNYDAPSPASSGALDRLACHLLEPPSHPEMLGRLGRYEVERHIGSGGMGVVFKAFDTELNRPVAIKVLAPHLAGSGAARKRFAREARAVAAVVHENVVAIHNVESEHESPFFVMQFIPGESLQARLNRQGPLELCEILRIGFQTATGLAAAQAQGLVHRDVKPSNILLENQVDRALLTDFGLARAGNDASLTHSGCLTGTPNYMSPEQARGESVGLSSDLFSLGSVLYAMCVGHPPFRAETAYGTLRRITDTPPRSLREQNSSVPEWLERLIFKLLSKEPASRFQSAQQVADLLENCLAHVQQPVTVPLPEFCQSPNTKSRWPIRRIAITTMGLLTGLGVAISQPWFAGDTPADEANQEKVNHSASPLVDSTESANPLSEWDRAQEQMDDLQRDAQSLDAELSPLW